MTLRMDDDFEACFISQVNEITHNSVQTAQEAFQLWQLLTDRQKNGMWDEIGRACRISGKQAHDRFHNKWSRQFYTDMAPYKQQIKSIIKANKHLNTVQLIRLIEQELKTEFHYQTMYQFVNYQLKTDDEVVLLKKLEKAASNPSQIEQTDDDVRLFSLNMPEFRTLGNSNQATECDLQKLEELLRKMDFDM